LQGQLPLKRVVLFGSWAKGRQTVASDVDVLVVYAGRPRADAYALVKRMLNLPRLEPHVYAEEGYEQARTVVERMIGGGISILPEITGTTPRTNPGAPEIRGRHSST